MKAGCTKASQLTSGTSPKRAGEEGKVASRDPNGRGTPDQIAEAQRLAREWKPKTER